MNNEEYDLLIFADGGARGNPGEAAYAFVVFRKQKIIHKEAKTIGIATNNIAEYSSVYKALSWIEKSDRDSYKNILFHLDSQLVAYQLSGKYKVKNHNLNIIYKKIKSIESRLGTNVDYKHIPREQNKMADKLVNIALDSQLS